MAYNFLRGDRDQPSCCPDPRDWLSQDHLVAHVLPCSPELRGNAAPTPIGSSLSG
jgi:hypothetical protein